MNICLSTVTLHLCRYICVPRQVFSELLCNKDTQRIAGKCFIWGSTLKDICSHKSVLGHPSREDDSDSTKRKKNTEVLLAKIWYQKQCFSCSASQSFLFPESQQEVFPKMWEVSFLNKWCVRGCSAKDSGPYCWGTWPKQFIPILHQVESMSSLFQFLPLFPLPLPLLLPFLLPLFLHLPLSFPLPLPLSVPSLPLPPPLSLHTSPMSIFIHCFQ